MSRIVPMDAAAVAVALDMEHHATLPGSDARLRQFGDWQQSVSEGPAVELYRTGAPVVLADVLSERRRWPLLASLDPTCSGLRSLVLLPLQAVAEPDPGAVLGFLAVARFRPDPFSGNEVKMLIHLAAVIYQMLVKRLTDPELLDTTPTSAVELGDDTLNVALGMAMAAFGVDRDDAYARLKGHAFVLGCTVWELAHDLVTGRRSATVLADDESHR